jgi:hypothetical protein
VEKGKYGYTGKNKEYEMKKEGRWKKDGSRRKTEETYKGTKLKNEENERREMVKTMKK